jgi:hypothetical protein
MNIPDHISDCSERIFWVKFLKLFYADPDPKIFLNLDPGSDMKKIRIRDKHPGSTTLQKSLEFLHLQILLGHKKIGNSRLNVKITE